MMHKQIPCIISFRQNIHYSNSSYEAEGFIFYGYSSHEFNDIQTARFTLNSDQEQAWNNKDTNDGYGGNY